MRWAKWILLIHLLMQTNYGQAQDSALSADEFTLKAAYIYRLTEFIRWPEEADWSETMEFEVACLGCDNRLVQSLNILFREKQIKDRVVKITTLYDLSQLKKPQILFIGSRATSQLQEILENPNNKGILFISDSPGFGLRGVHINFVMVDRHIKLELNIDAIQHTQFSVNSRLMQVAILLPKKRAMR